MLGIRTTFQGENANRLKAQAYDWFWAAAEKSAVPVMFLALTLENPANVPAAGLWKSPLYPLGQALLTLFLGPFTPLVEPIGLDDRRKRVSRPGGPHVGAVCGSLADERLDLVLADRPGDPGGFEVLVANPVGPGDGHRVRAAYKPGRRHRATTA